MPPLHDALSLCTRLVALSVALQTLELIALRRAFAEHGIWRPALLARAGVPAALASVAGLQLVLVAQLVLAALLAVLGPSPLPLVLALGQLALVIRLGGPFNGGSDSLSLLSLLGLGVAASVSPGSLVYQIALGYLAAQLTLSYFIAGVAKLAQPSWREGTALGRFAALPKYGVPARARAWLATPSLGRMASWSVLLFECSFPLALLGPRFALAYLSVGALFHVLNAALFGLNRFLWAWLALYPLLLAASQWGPLAARD